VQPAAVDDSRDEAYVSDDHRTRGEVGTRIAQVEREGKRVWQPHSSCQRASRGSEARWGKTGGLPKLIYPRISCPTTTSK